MAVDICVVELVAMMGWYVNCNHIIVSIDYRLVPEFPYPTDIEDSKVAIRGVFAALHEHHIKYRDRKLTIGVNAELMQVAGVVHPYLLMEDLCPEECAKTYQEINKFLNT